jgi:uncharacterized membrane protein
MNKYNQSTNKMKKIHYNSMKRKFQLFLKLKLIRFFMVFLIIIYTLLIFTSMSLDDLITDVS